MIPHSGLSDLGMKWFAELAYFLISAAIQDETGMKVVPIRILTKELESDDQLIRSLKKGVVLFERG